MASSGDAYKSPQPSKEAGAGVDAEKTAGRPALVQGSTAERLDAMRAEVDHAARQARHGGLWKHQVRVFDFYHDHGRRRPYVQTAVAGLIVANFLCNAAQRQLDPRPDMEDRKHKAFWFALDYTFNIAFLIELLVNMYGSWMWPFFRDGWNIFDLVVVTVGVVDMVQIPYPPTLKLVRLFRTFRVFRLFGRVESLRRIVLSIRSALPGVINVLVLGFILLSIYAVIAVDLFGDLYSDCGPEDPAPVAVTARGNCYGTEYYGTFLSALYTLFQILTGESWSEAGVRPILHYFLSVRRDRFMVAVAAVFFVSFIMINSFIILNVIVAALLDGMMSDKDGDGIPDFMDDDIGPPEKAVAAPACTRRFEEDVRTLRAEVADLNSKMDVLIRIQRDHHYVPDDPDPPNLIN